MGRANKGELSVVSKGNDRKVESFIDIASPHLITIDNHAQFENILIHRLLLRAEKDIVELGNESVSFNHRSTKLVNLSMIQQSAMGPPVMIQNTKV
jgi:hypothetical protein